MVDHPRNAADRLICALDVSTKGEALKIIEEIGDEVTFYKVGLQLFISEGLIFVSELNKIGKKVFLDLKMDDVTETIKLAVESIARGASVELLTIHGNGATVKAAREGRNGNTKPYLLSVTLLSSLDNSDLKDMQLVGSGEKYRFKNLDEFVAYRADAALKAGCEGLIASGSTIEMIRGRFPGDYLIVSPGIRPAGKSTDDHKRSTTPADAIRAGADYLVVGRPIRDDKSRRDSAKRIIDEIESALAVRA